MLEIEVLRADLFSHETVEFKLDSGSDFTTLSNADLSNLGYAEEYLRSRPKHEPIATTADGKEVHFQYLENISIMFQGREIQGCRVFFALGTDLRSLFGADILKYFNREIDYDAGELRLKERRERPLLSPGEEPLHIYSIEY
ncbi:MAG: retroviral-like aspartic protease family protein [Clostridiales bacterium]|jgi:hypothetical protein|nr:retroviral-like aspartic protease family protein [Clostridiales bacterium]